MDTRDLKYRTKQWVNGNLTDKEYLEYVLNHCLSFESDNVISKIIKKDNEPLDVILDAIK